MTNFWLWIRLLVLGQIFFRMAFTQEGEIDESKNAWNIDDEDYVFTEIPKSRNHRSWTGPAEEYDLMGATQFNLLTSLGLRENHTVLDYGCGSLRAGRFIMLYLFKGNYYCVEPYDSLLRDAINFEIGRDLLSISHERATPLQKQLGRVRYKSLSKV